MSVKQARVVLITGCSSGIGRVTAEWLLRRGHVVYVTARRVESVTELKETLTGFGDRAQIRRLDVTSPEMSASVIDDLIHKQGRIDALINNAAYGQSGAVEELTSEDLRRQFEVNVVGLLDLTRRVIPLMRSAGSGRIINVSSVVAHVPLPLTGAYVASKAALNSLSECLRMELRGTGIEVVLIEPGAIATAFRDNSVASLGDRLTSPDSPYHKHYQRWLQRWKKQLGEAAAPPECVARAIVRAVEARRPKTRYRITAAARFGPLVYAILPDRLADWIIVSRFGLKG